ncbi:uncharacterized protein BDFB_011976 [Asbolus verrucosus]|uniref:Uncharacterized protein n=1 Tax=Asbolus verrucosus TaxID=1661398 RepID=A0A482VFK0_ASBVE|nr:uncharacterized protein BDFB_011976 [Asbolus verrucosus]
MDPEQNCSHTIHRSKYERNAPEIKNWWYKLFDLLESDAAIPPDRRLDVVKEIFPAKLLNKILSILSFIRPCKSLRDEKPLKEESAEEKNSEVSIFGSDSDEDLRRKQIGLKNPYITFFKRRPDRAAIWHTLPPLSLEEMNLIQRAESITKTIATDFVAWMENISDEDSPTSLTVPLVLKMFEIGFNTDAARSLQVRVKEMASVPDGVAILKNIPDMAKRSQLHRQLLRDLAASEQSKKDFAFGTKLGKENQFHPPKKSEIEKWLVCTRVPSELESMAAVWQGITHLRSTRAYCEYLLEHPEIKPPKFLVEMKMLDRNAIKTDVTTDVPEMPQIKVPSKSLTREQRRSQ